MYHGESLDRVGFVLKEQGLYFAYNVNTAHDICVRRSPRCQPNMDKCAVICDFFSLINCARRDFHFTRNQKQTQTSMTSIPDQQHPLTENVNPTKMYKRSKTDFNSKLCADARFPPIEQVRVLPLDFSNLHNKRDEENEAPDEYYSFRGGTKQLAEETRSTTT